MSRRPGTPVRSAGAAAWVLACVGAIGTAQAAEWRIQPRVEAEESWSDNINLSSVDQRTDFITQVTPGVGITGRGGRIDLDLDYQLGMVHYARGTSRRRFDHRLQANGSAELVSQRFFVDFSSTAGQVNTTSTGTLTRDNISNSGNRSTFYTYSVNPYLVHHFGRYADGRLAYEHSRVNNSNAVSSTINGVDFSLTSGSEFSTLPWTVDADLSRTSNSTGRDSETRVIDGSITYPYSRRYALRLNAGYEDNQLVTSRSDTSGMTWRVTGIWTPSARTSIELGYGKRFFGNSVSFDATHRSRRAIFSASYNEDSTTTARRQLQLREVEFLDAFGQPIENPGLAPFEVPTNTPTLTDEALITRRFSGDVTLQLRRGSTSLGVFHERRQFGVSQNEETVFGADASWTHRLDRRTSASLIGNWQQSEFGVSNSDATLWRVQLRLTHQIHKDVSGSLSYSHQENDSSTAGNSYSENRVNARVNVLF